MRCPYGRELDLDQLPWKCPHSPTCHCKSALAIYTLGDLTPDVATVVRFWQDLAREAPTGAIVLNVCPLPSGNGDIPVHTHY